MGVLVYPCLISLGNEFPYYLKKSHVEEACPRNPSIASTGFGFCVEERGADCLFALVDLSSCNKLCSPIEAVIRELLKNQFSLFILVNDENKNLKQELIDRTWECFIRTKPDAEDFLKPFCSLGGIIEILHDFEKDIPYRGEIVHRHDTDFDMDSYRKLLGKIIFKL